MTSSCILGFQATRPPSRAHFIHPLFTTRWRIASRISKHFWGKRTAGCKHHSVLSCLNKGYVCMYRGRSMEHWFLRIAPLWLIEFLRTCELKRVTITLLVVLKLYAVQKVYNRRLVGVSVYFLSRHIAGQVVYYYNGCPTVNYFQRMLKVCIRAAVPNGQSI